MKIWIAAAVLVIIAVTILGIQTMSNDSDSPAGEPDPMETSIDEISLFDIQEERRPVVEFTESAEEGTVFAFFQGAA